ncbi:hypothetical protein J4O75_29765 [Paenibacillus pabuli]
MAHEDIARIARLSPKTKLIAVHYHQPLYIETKSAHQVSGGTTPGRCSLGS